MMCLEAVAWVGYAQEADSIKIIQLNGVTVSASYQRRAVRSSALQVDVAGERFLSDHFTGNLVQTLQHLPGVHSMDIGSGFSKPVIRGMGFNRISVTENGIKQEGQQWGADHGLELDAFNAGRVIVRKGAASLLYGSDAMGGSIEIVELPAPTEDQLFGETVWLGKSVNGTLGASFMLGVKNAGWYGKIRYSEQRFGDYHVPADTVVYLTQRQPLYGRKLKNTAGLERDVSWYVERRRGAYVSHYAVSNAYQKAGFFPGAHGIPDLSRLQDDGDSRNVELPFSTVNHLKVSTRQQYAAGEGLTGTWDVGYQNNYREERSLFHTHYGEQPVPADDPDKELAFGLNTYSSSLKLRVTKRPLWEHTVGWDVQYQQNRISGYSFLLPAYNRFATGLFWLANWRPAPTLTVSGGIRYDYGRVAISAYLDPYLDAYLAERGYGGDEIEAYRWRSYPADRRFGNFSGSVGIVWEPREGYLFKTNLGRSFRLPGANELASNGVHHGTFRHEQGDPSLPSEQGWLLDVSGEYAGRGFSFSVSPFGGWFGHYIYLRPTGEWSVLPHAGQIYRYTDANALFAGTEITLDVDFLRCFNYRFTGEYVYTYNRDEHVPLAFSPPATVRNVLAVKVRSVRFHTEWEHVGAQNRVARNEDPTPGADLLHAGMSLHLPYAEVSLSFRNVLNTRYYNHLSFYRKVEIPEPGRSVQLMIKTPFHVLFHREKE
jgi:iron complex outermembrane receptor protein